MENTHKIIGFSVVEQPRGGGREGRNLTTKEKTQKFWQKQTKKGKGLGVRPLVVEPLKKKHFLSGVFS